MSPSFPFPLISLPCLQPEPLNLGPAQYPYSYFNPLKSQQSDFQGTTPNRPQQIFTDAFSAEESSASTSSRNLPQSYKRLKTSHSLNSSTLSSIFPASVTFQEPRIPSPENISFNHCGPESLCTSSRETSPTNFSRNKRKRLELPEQSWPYGTAAPVSPDHLQTIAPFRQIPRTLPFRNPTRIPLQPDNTQRLRHSPPMDRASDEQIDYRFANLMDKTFLTSFIATEKSENNDNHWLRYRVKRDFYSDVVEFKKGDTLLHMAARILLKKDGTMRSRVVTKIFYLICIANLIGRREDFANVRNSDGYKFYELVGLANDRLLLKHIAYEVNLSKFKFNGINASQQITNKLNHIKRSFFQNVISPSSQSDGELVAFLK